MKIVILPSWFPSQQSPLSGIFIREQAETLAILHDVAVVLPRNRSWRDILRFRGRQETRIYREGLLTIVSQSWQSAFPRCPTIWTLRQHIRAFSRGIEHLAEHWGHPDILHAHVVLPAGLAAVEIGSQLQIPVVLTEHTSPFAVHLKTCQHRERVRRVLDGADRVLAVSPGLAQQINVFAPQVPIVVTGEMIRTQLFAPHPNTTEDGSATQFLTVALLSEQKGIAHLLKATQLLMLRGIRNFHLTIGGDGDIRTQLERSASVLGLTRHCRFLGALTRDQVRVQMQACDAFVLPSMHETFGIVVGEAMACGKPVITTRCGGPEYFVTPEVGVLVEPGDAEGLSHAMETIIRRRVRYSGDIIRKSITDRFGEQAFLDTHTAIYAELLAEIARDHSTNTPSARRFGPGSTTVGKY